MQTFTDVRKWLKKNERILLPSMLLLGVLVDFITFKNIKITSAFMILGLHYIFLGCAIVWSHTTFKKRIFTYLHILSPLIIQFSLGALLSASLIFYWFSGTFSASWPILGLIAILMFSNEVFREKFQKPNIQIGAYYFVSFSVLTLILPFIFRSISVWLFIAAGFLSLAIVYAYLHVTSQRVVAIKKSKDQTIKIIISIFIGMNLLYIFNIIPPIPLSLTDAGIYHNITRSNGNYTLQQETESIFQKIIPGTTIHIRPGQSIYAFSSIFAPTRLNTTIYHQWEFYDDDKNKWIEKSRPGFAISGGREKGYRGFSQKSALKEGSWRVIIQTKGKRVLGKIKFKLKTQSTPPNTNTIIK